MSGGIALVTGASRGIGAAAAQRLARDGFSVVVNYHSNEGAAQQVVDQIKAGGGMAIAVKCDVADEAEVLAMFATVDDTLGKISVLVNNAGVVSPQGTLLNMDAQRIRRVMDINVLGTILCAREAVKRMSTSSGGDGGVIVNVSSVAARLGAPGEYLDYAASKGAVDTFTIGLSKEVATQGIRVNAVRPGIIETDIHASGGDPGRYNRIAPQVPMGRGGQSSEVAAAVAWLASEDASYVSGSIVDVAGAR